MEKTTGCRNRYIGRVISEHRYTLGFLLIAFLSAGCATMAEKADTVAPIVGRLADMRASQPGPVWNTVIHANEADHLQPVGDDKILVGTLGAPGDLFSVSHLEFMLLDSKTGKQIWTYPRSSMGGSYQTVLAVNPVFLVQVTYGNKNKYCALDQHTGKLLWEREVTSLVSSSLMPSQAMIMVVEASGPNLNAYAINLTDGRDIWKQEIAGFNPSKSESLSLFTSGDGVIVFGKEILNLSIKNGTIFWRVLFPGTYGDGAVFSLQEDGLFLSDGKKLCLLNLKSGAVAWATPSEGAVIRHIAPVDKSVFIIARVMDGKSSHDIVRALRRSDGTAIWSCPLQETIQSPLLSGTKGLYFSSQTKLYSLDSLKGGIRFATPIPAPLNQEVDLPDALSEYDQKIILARETGVAAFSPDKGSLLFSEQVTGGRSFTYRYSINRILEANQVVAGPKNASQVLAQAQSAQESGFLRMAQANRDFVYAKTDPTVSSGTRIPSSQELANIEKRPVIGIDQILNTDYARPREAQPSEMSKRETTLRFARSIVVGLTSLGAALEGVILTTLVTNRNHRLSNSIFSHSSSLNYEAGVYIRPFYRNGLNLAMVDLKTGKRADFALSPHIDPLGLFGVKIIKLPAFAIDRSGTKLIVKGLGLQESQYETYEMTAEGCGTDMRNWTIPYPSILSYDIPAIFRAANPTRAQVIQDRMVSDKERTMITAAFNGDEKTVKAMLEQGANVNAIDEDGHTALMHAAAAVKPDVIELLVKSGADGNIEDEDCWNGLRYFLLTTPSGTGSMFTRSKIARLLLEAGNRDKK
jgi:outer membrane protein assembly factor BamB